MGRRPPYPWGPPPRRLVGRCNICGCWMFLHRYRFCDACYQEARDLAADLFTDRHD